MVLRIIQVAWTSDIIMRKYIFFKCFSYCKIKPQWFEFNDEFVSKLNGDLNRDSLSAYALFYSKNNN